MNSSQDEFRGLSWVTGPNYLEEPRVGYGMQGTNYQVQLSIYFVFDAYLQNKNFMLMSEAKNFGSADDILIYFPDSRQLSCIQVKHASSLDPEKNIYTYGLLKEPLSKLFFSWCLLKSKGYNPEIILHANHRLGIRTNSFFNQNTHQCLP